MKCMSFVSFSKSWFILVALLFLLPISIGISTMYGTKYIDASSVYTAFFAFDATNVDHQIIIHSRLARALGSVLIGSALAVSGALMQGITHNPLASPALMGVSDGSALAVTICMIVFPAATMTQQIVFSFVGSAAGAGLVFGLASSLPRGLSPATLAILGAVIGTFLSGVAVVLTMYFQIAQDISFWYHARLHQLQLSYLQIAIPFITAGLGMAFSIRRSLTVLAFGDDIATSLGQKTMQVKIIASFAVVLLTGSSVALAGKIGFVGLIIPHIARFFVGSDYARIVPITGLLGGVGLAFADVASRFLNYPFETPIGVITSIIGVPFFLYLARKKGGMSHV